MMAMDAKYCKEEWFFGVVVARESQWCKYWIVRGGTMKRMLGWLKMVGVSCFQSSHGRASNVRLVDDS